MALGDFMALSYNPDVMDRMFDMDPDLLHLLTHEITAFAQWDVLRYFLENGHAQASMDDISIAVGRDSEALIDMLGQLTTRGWLARRTDKQQTIYLLTQEQERRRLLERLHASFHDHTFRLQVIYHWTQGV